MNTSLHVPNFRDVGETVNILGGLNLMKKGVLYRGGELGLVNDLTLIHSPLTIINLRKGADPTFDSAVIIDCPAPNSVDVYLADSGANRKWIISVLKILASAEFRPPFYIHCAAGKDRTGVIIAAILSCLEISKEIVQQDYELSDGPLYPELFATETLGAFDDIDYFRKIDKDTVRALFRLQ